MRKLLLSVLAAIATATHGATRVGDTIAPAGPGFPATEEQYHKGGWHSYETVSEVPPHILSPGMAVMESTTSNLYWWTGISWSPLMTADAVRSVTGDNVYIQNIGDPVSSVLSMTDTGSNILDRALMTDGSRIATNLPIGEATLRYGYFGYMVAHQGFFMTGIGTGDPLFGVTSNGIFYLYNSLKWEVPAIHDGAGGSFSNFYFLGDTTSFPGIDWSSFEMAGAAEVVQTNLDIHITNTLSDGAHGAQSIVSLGFVPSTNLTADRGDIWYEDGDDALTYQTGYEDVKVQIGQETLIHVYNDTGVGISNGVPVYCTGAHGDKPTVAPAYLDGDTQYVIGVTTMPIEHGGTGYVTCRGIVRDVDTSSYDLGSRLFLTTTPGVLSTNESSVCVALVVRKQENTGKLFVSPHPLGASLFDFTYHTNLDLASGAHGGELDPNALLADGSRTATNGLSFGDGVDSKRIAHEAGSGGLVVTDGESNNELIRVTDTGNLIVTNGSVSASGFYVTGVGPVLTSETDPYLAIQNDATLDPSGFESPELVDVAYDPTNRTMTVTQSGGIVMWWRGERLELGSPWVSTPHGTGEGSYWLAMRDSTNIVWTTNVAWTIPMAQIGVARITTSLTNGFREAHGLMPWEAHLEFHQQVGTYVSSGCTADPATYALNMSSPTDASNTVGFIAGVIKDEDCPTTIPAWPEGQYTVLWFTGSGTVNMTTTNEFPYRIGVTYPLVNGVSSGAFSETETVQNRWLNYYHILVPVTSDPTSQQYRMLVLQPQAAHSSLNAALVEDFRSLNLGEFTVFGPEKVAYCKLTYRTSSSYSTTGKVRLENVSYLTGSQATQVSVGSITAPTVASAIAVTTTDFDGNLSSADLNVQLALDTLDDMVGDNLVDILSRGNDAGGLSITNAGALQATWTPVTISSATTVTISTINGSLQSLVVTNSPCTIVMDTAAFPTGVVGRVTLELWAGTNSITWDTNTISWATAYSGNTNDWVSVLLRKSLGTTVFDGRQ